MQRVIVIDDDDSVRDLMVRILVRAGYEVAPAKGGRDGVALCRKQPPDLIVTDIIMPDQDGIETILQLRRLAPSIPIIAISGGGRANLSGFLDAAHKLGANSVLQKPFKPVDLLAAITELLGVMPEKQHPVAA